MLVTRLSGASVPGGVDWRGEQGDGTLENKGSWLRPPT